MKQIFPTGTSNNTVCPNNKAITQQQYDDLVNRVNDAECASCDAVSCVDRLIQEQQNQVCTNNVKANSGTISSFSSEIISASSADIGTLNTECITSDAINVKNETAESIISDTATIGSIASNTVDAGNIIADSATIKEATVDELTTSKLNLEGELNVDDLKATNFEAVTSQADQFIGTNAAITEIHSDHAVVGNAEVDSLKAYKTESNIIDTNYIIHERDPQEVNELGDLYLLFPQFTNGFYLVEADNDTHKRLWSFELTNSIKNIQFRWSESELGQIVDLKFKTDAAGISIVQVHVHTNEHISLFRNSITTSNILPIEIHTEDQIPDQDPPMLVVTHQSGTYIQDVIFTNKLHIDCLEMDALFMDCVGVYRELWLTCDYNQSGEIVEPIPSAGENGDYIANTTSCGIVHPSWQKPADWVNPLDQYDTGNVDSDGNPIYKYGGCHLIPSGVVASYDGSVSCIEDDTTCYPIKHLNEDTCVHGNIEVECNTKTDTFNSAQINDSNLECRLENGLTNVHTAVSCTYSDDLGFTNCFEETHHDYYGGRCVWELKNPEDELYIALRDRTDAGPWEIFRWIGPVATICQYCGSSGCLCLCALDKAGEVIYDNNHPDWAEDMEPIPGYIPVEILSPSNFPPTVTAKVQKDIVSCCIGPWSRAKNERLDELAVYNCECQWKDEEDEEGNVIKGADKKLLVYNQTTNAIEPTDEATLDTLEVDNLKVKCCAEIGCDLVVGNNLYVKGKTVTTEEETVSTSSDMIVLRQNNGVGLANGEVSGVLVNKYDGTNNLALVTDCTGTLRVGEVTGTSTTCSIIYQKGGKWYDYDEDTEEYTEVTPTGELTAYASKEINSDNYTEYTDAVFTEFDYSGLSPVLGRDETEAMANNALLRWNAATWEANTISVPTVDGSVLKYRAPHQEICGYDCKWYVCYSGDLYESCCCVRNTDGFNNNCVYTLATVNVSHCGVADRKSVPWNPLDTSACAYVHCNPYYYGQGPIIGVVCYPKDGVPSDNPSLYCTQPVVLDQTNGTLCVCNYPSGISPYINDDQYRSIFLVPTSETYNKTYKELGYDWGGTCANTADKCVAYPRSLGTTACLVQVCIPVYCDAPGTYYWERDPGIYCFATMACYNAVCDDIPTGSMVIIDECENTLRSEI